MIKNIIFDMGNVLLKFDRNYFLDAVGVRPEDQRTLMNNVYLSLEWAKMDRGSMTEAEAAASMCSRLPERLHEQAHLLVDRWDRPILPVPGSEYFDGTLISADVKLVKPCAEIYELLYSTFGLIPGECLFIDDSAPNIEGAERTGMPGIVFHGDADELRSEMNAFGVNI